MTATTLRSATAALSVLAMIGTGAISSAAAGDVSFPSAVEQVLLRQQGGPLGRLSEEKKLQLIVCVNEVLAALPSGKKRFVIEAGSDDELEHRFGEVVMENRAEWKQKIER